MYKIGPYRVNPNLSRDVFDLFDDFFTTTPVQGKDFKIDVRDLKDKYLVEAELPGFKKEEINIKYDDERLTISVFKEETEEDKTDDYIHQERHMFRSERSVHLKDVNPANLKAKLDNGILTVELNKFEHKINSYTVNID